MAVGLTMPLARVLTLHDKYTDREPMIQPRKSLCAIAAVFVAMMPLAGKAQDREPIAEAIAQLVSSNIAGTDIRGTDTRIGSLEIKGTEGSSKTYYAARSVQIPFLLPVVGSNGVVLPVMTSVINSIESACSKSGGAIQRMGFSASTSDPVVQKAITELSTAKLYGDFVCSGDSKTYFRVQVYPQTMSDQSWLPPGWKWNIFVHYMSRTQFEKIESAEEATRAMLTRFRSSIASGQEVAIRAQDIPASLHPSLPSRSSSFLSDGQYRICGLVIDLKEQLAQIQVGATALFVPKSKLFPFKEARTLDHSISADWDNWCVRK